MSRRPLEGPIRVACTGEEAKSGAESASNAKGREEARAYLDAKLDCSAEELHLVFGDQLRERDQESDLECFEAVVLGRVTLREVDDASEKRLSIQYLSRAVWPCRVRSGFRPS